MAVKNLSRSCELCGTTFVRRRRSSRFCSLMCSARHQRSHTPKIPLATRFWRHVQRAGPDECWIWTAATDTLGYARINRWVDGVQVSTLAHRVAWELAYGSIQSDLFVCHRCDNPSCVNHAHLFLGTHTDNMRDCTSKGRQKAKLTQHDVRAIRARYAAGSISQLALAADYDVSQANISCIVLGATWRHVK